MASRRADGVCLGSRGGVRRALASKASAWARVGGVLACRLPLAAFLRLTPCNESRGLYTASEWLSFAPRLHPARRKRYRERRLLTGCSDDAETHNKSVERAAMLKSCGVLRELCWPTKSHKSRPPDAMGAPPCVFVSDPSGRKALGIPKRPRNGSKLAPLAPLDTVEYALIVARPLLTLAYANGNRCAANKQAAG